MWFTTFSRSGLGLALAAHARNVRTAAGEDVTALIVDYYERRFRQESHNAVIVRDVHRGYPIDVNSLTRFTQRFRKWLPWVKAEHLSSEYDDKLARLCFEAIQNVYDHANRAPHPMGCAIFSCFAMRYYRTVSAPTSSGLPLRAYLERLASSIDANEEHPAFLELVVNDDGVGVAARQTQQADIYWGDFSVERAACDAAFRPGSTVKLRAVDAPIRGDPGFGSVVILDAIKKLKAYAELRTGRVRAFMDGADLSARHFTFVQNGHGYLPGTFLHVVIPLRQVQLKLL